MKKTVARLLVRALFGVSFLIGVFLWAFASVMTHVPGFDDVLIPSLVDGLVRGQRVSSRKFRSKKVLELSVNRTFWWLSESQRRQVVTQAWFRLQMEE